MKDVIFAGAGLGALVLCCTVVGSGPPGEVIIGGLERGTVAAALGGSTLLAWGLFFFSK